MEIFLINKLGKITQGLIEKKLRELKIKLNKKKVKSSTKITFNDKIEFNDLIGHRGFTIRVVGIFAKANFRGGADYAIVAVGVVVIVHAPVVVGVVVERNVFS